MGLSEQPKSNETALADRSALQKSAALPLEESHVEHTRCEWCWLELGEAALMLQEFRKLPEIARRWDVETSARSCGRPPMSQCD